MKDYATDMPLDDARQLHAPLEKELADIQNADCSDEDAIANVKAWISAAKESVQFNMDRFCAGGMYHPPWRFHLDKLRFLISACRLPVTRTRQTMGTRTHWKFRPNTALMLALDTDNALDNGLSR